VGPNLLIFWYYRWIWLWILQFASISLKNFCFRHQLWLLKGVLHCEILIDTPLLVSRDFVWLSRFISCNCCCGGGKVDCRTVLIRIVFSAINMHAVLFKDITTMAISHIKLIIMLTNFARWLIFLNLFQGHLFPIGQNYCFNVSIHYSSVAVDHRHFCVRTLPVSIYTPATFCLMSTCS